MRSLSVALFAALLLAFAPTVHAQMTAIAGVTVVPGTDVGVNLTDFGEALFLELEAH